MKTIKGPALFIAQFLSDTPPFDTLDNICSWAAKLGYKALQIPTWDPKYFDLDQASNSKTYCLNIKNTLAKYGLEIAELASYLQGQVMAIHPAYLELFQAFYPKNLTENQRTQWAQDQLFKTIKASENLGTKNISVLSGGLAWPYVYPWPQRPEGLIDLAFSELAARWLPVLDFAYEKSISLGFELHPGSDLFDGASFNKFLDAVNYHSAAGITFDASHFVLQQLDYLAFIDIFKDRIKAFHVKDAEFNPNGLTGVYGGYNSWANRAGRFRSIGDGQVDFKKIFSKLSQYDFEGWAILEWECCIKDQEQGAREGANLINSFIINTASRAFDDFAKTEVNQELNNKLLGIS